MTRGAGQARWRGRRARRYKTPMGSTGYAIESSSILVVTPTTGWCPRDEVLEGMLYDMLGAEKPTALARTLNGLGENYPVFWLPGNARRYLRDQLGRATGSSALRGLAIADSREIMIDLLRALFSKDITGALPGASMLPAGHPDLAELTCGEGAFKVGVAYASHPLDARCFLPVATFHDRLLSEKRAEFLRIVSALGASAVNVVDDRNRSGTASAHAGVQAPGDGAQLGAKGGASGAASDRFHLSATFGKPRRPPLRAANLRWALREPLWEGMIEARLDGNVEALDVDFAYESDYAVTASVAATLEGIGLGVGGSFKGATCHRQTYTVTFHPHESA